MKLLSISLVALLALIQYPLWLGKGGWLRVWELDRQLVKQQSANQVLASRNISLEAEVRDLQEGRQAVEERARYELGMVRKNEIFIQINEPPSVRPVVDIKPVLDGNSVGGGVPAIRPATAKPASPLQ